MMKTIRQPQIAIIGAGFSGSYLARMLLDSGLKVTVFEKSRGTGGRISSCRLNNVSADLGAPFISYRSKAFEQWLKQQPDISTWAPKTNDFSGKALTSQTFFTAIPRQSSLTRRLIQGAHFIPKQRIGKLSYDVNKDKLNHAVYNDEGLLQGHFDAVIITTPAQQAVPLLKTDTPSKFADKADNVMTITRWVQVLIVNAADYPTPELITGNHPLLFRCVKDCGKPNRESHMKNDVWVIEANKKWSQLNINSSAEEVEQQLTQSFIDLFPSKPTVLSTRTHRWLYARHKATDDIFLWDCDKRIGACGDWLASNDLEGAWISASHLAERIIQKFYSDR